MPRFIVGLDVGSSTIKTVIGEIRRDGGITVLRVMKHPSQGIRKGVVHDIAELTQSLSPVLAEVKKFSKDALAEIFLGIGSSDIKVQSSIGIVAVSRADYEINEDDVKRAMQSAQAINIPANRLVLHSIVREYIVDGVRDIRDPVEMVGNRLEVNSLIIDAFAPNIKNLMKCVEMLGGEVRKLILQPLADARAILTKSQRELGVVLVDIGYGKTSMCVYEEGKIVHAAVFPVGASNITNDLAIGLKIPVHFAERVKLSYGSAIAKEIPARENIELSKIDPGAKGHITKRYIAEIIEARLAEIFKFVNNELGYLKKAGQLPGGVVLTGGGAKIPSIIELAKQELHLAAQIANPDLASYDIRNSEDATMLDDPELTAGLGLLLMGYDSIGESKKFNIPLGGATSLLKKAWKYFAP
ncbi:MAG: cell division protein FtsA [Patescibacteria group bacterium]